MARTASSSDKKTSGAAPRTRNADAESQDESVGKKILLAIPRALGSAVRSITGVGEYDPVYRRDGLCFLMLVLAVFFCASEWFRVDGVLGRVLA